MKEYIFILTQKILTGLRQMFGYMNNRLWLIIFGWISIVVPIVWLIVTWDSIKKYKGLIVLLIFATAACGILSYMSLGIMPFDTHLWTYLESVLFPWAMVLAGKNWIDILGGVTLGGVLFKGFVDTAFGWPFIKGKEVTDIAGGKFFGIPSLGIKIPRLSNGWIRLGIALVVGLFVILNHYYWHVEFNIFTIYKWLGIKIV